MHEQNRSPIPTALVCVFLLLVLVLGGGVVGIMYLQLKVLQSQNQSINAAMAAQQAKMAALKARNAELEAVNNELRALSDGKEAGNEQFRAQFDAPGAESE